MNPNIFRMYDIRGIAETDLTDDVVTLIGKAYGTLMKRAGKHRISVGRDVRLSSSRIQKALVNGILSTGLDVIDVGELPTPVLYFSIVQLDADGSVMVTGSHNPIEFNGLKINDGMLSIYGEQIQALRSQIESEDFEAGKGTLIEASVVPSYMQMLKERIQIMRPFKLVIDAGNGTAGPIAPAVFREMGCEVICLFCEPDGTFPNHLPDPTVMKYIEPLRKAVIKEEADLGIGYDGDSDRLGVIDEQGRVVYADKLLAILAREVLDRNPGATIPFDVKCSQLLFEEIKKAGGKPLMWKTGHSLIKKKMQEVNAPLAGEMSGHIFYKDRYFGYDDGIYASFRLVEYLSSQRKSLGRLVDELPQFVSTPEIRITCPDEDKFKVVDALTEDFRKTHEVVDVDGARVLFGDGWGLVRVSNTQPILVLRFEAKNEARLKEIQNLFREKLSAFPAVHVNEMDMH
ncbi:MAG TPA: phosphomannomutase/phosphoglucomutase [bacterium]|nr:phosphomannomutase/phosphoglucomutase [bacterium]